MSPLSETSARSSEDIKCLLIKAMTKEDEHNYNDTINSGGSNIQKGKSFNYSNEHCVTPSVSPSSIEHPDHKNIIERNDSFDKPIYISSQLTYDTYGSTHNSSSVNGLDEYSSLIGNNMNISRGQKYYMESDDQLIASRTDRSTNSGNISSNRSGSSYEAFIQLYRRKYHIFEDLRNTITWIIRGKWKVTYLFVLFLLGFGILLCVFLKNFNSIVPGAIDIDLDEVVVLNFDERGFGFKATGAIYKDYNKVQNVIYRVIMKEAAKAIGTVTLVPTKNMKIFLSQTSSKELIHVFDIEQPEIEMDLTDNKISSFEYEGYIRVYHLELGKLLENINGESGDNIDIEIQSVLNLKVLSNLVNFNMKNIRVQETYNISRKDLVPPFEIKNFDASSREDELIVDLNFEILKLLPMELLIGPIRWDLMVLDCDKNLVKVGTISTGHIAIFPNVPTVIKSNGTIINLPQGLLEPCAAKDSSVIGGMIQSFLNEEYISIYLSASKYQRSSLPKWLDYLLQHIQQKVDVILPRKVGAFHSYSVKNIVLDLSDDEDNGKFTMRCDGNVSVLIENKLDIPFNVSDFNYKYSLGDSESPWVTGSSKRFSSLHISNILNFLELDIVLRSGVNHILEPRILGTFFNSLIEGESPQPLDLTVEIDKIAIELPVGNVRFDKLIANVPNLQMPYQFPGFNDIMEMLSISVNEILLLETSELFASLLVSLELVYLNDFILEMQETVISLEIRSNKTKLIEAQIKGMPNSSGNYPMMVDMKVWNINNAKKLEKSDFDRFLSDYVSDGDVFVDIDNISSLNRLNLNDLLQQIKLQGIKVPNFRFDRDSDDEFVGDKNLDPDVPRSKAFLLNAVIHIFSSEVQLTVYNPIANVELGILLTNAYAKYKDTYLGSLKNQEYLIIPPGIYETPKIPIKVSQGLGMDILRKAVNGQLVVDVDAEFILFMSHFKSSVTYQGKDLKSSIRF